MNGVGSNGSNGLDFRLGMNGVGLNGFTQHLGWAGAIGLILLFRVVCCGFKPKRAKQGQLAGRAHAHAPHGVTPDFPSNQRIERPPRILLTRGTTAGFYPFTVNGFKPQI
jgi:hypothetical protein